MRTTTKLLLSIVLSLHLGWACAQPKAPQSNADHRVALVIGNDIYRHIPKLENAVNDAEAMAKELRDVGFEVLRHSNLDRRGMNVAIRDFEKRIEGGGVGVFFFAGHGVQTKAGGNLLLPVDVPLPSDEKLLTNDAVVLADVLEDMKNAKAKFTLAIVDACRDNPLAKAGVRNVGGTRGLAPVQAEGTMVIFSAGAGQQALDKIGPNDTAKNGLFTREFITGMREPNVPVDRMVKGVQRRVQEKAQSVGHTQRPAIYNESTDDFIFRVTATPATSTANVPARALGHDPESEYWNFIRETERPELFEAYLAEFPKGRFIKAAELRLRMLVARAAPAAQATTVALNKPANTGAVPVVAGSKRSLNELLNEEVITVKTGGFLSGRDLETTYYRPEGPGPFPVMVYVHPFQEGLAAGTHARVTPKLFALHAVARGYAVAVPSLPGYGKSVGLSSIQAECDPLRFNESLSDVIYKFIVAGLGRPYIDASRVVLYGGWVPSCLSRGSIAGVKGVIHTNGGMLSGRNCDIREINTNAAIEYARTATVKQIWLYGKTETNLDVLKLDQALQALPTVKTGLVSLFRLDRPSPGSEGAYRGAAPWLHIDEFLSSIALPARADYGFANALAGANGEVSVSVDSKNWTETQQAALTDFESAKGPKAYAMQREGRNAWGWVTGGEAVGAVALARCERAGDVTCKVTMMTERQ